MGDNILPKKTLGDAFLIKLEVAGKEDSIESRDYLPCGGEPLFFHVF